MNDSLTLQTVQQQLCGEIQTLLSLKPGSVSPESALASLGMDSLRLVSLLLVIEQKFGVSLMSKGLSPQDMQSISTLAAAVISGRQG
jgi:acyl carrier protein